MSLVGCGVRFEVGRGPQVFQTPTVRLIFESTFNELPHFLLEIAKEEVELRGLYVGQIFSRFVNQFSQEVGDRKFLEETIVQFLPYDGIRLFVLDGVPERFS